jgi:hypothetical protein
MDSTTPEFIEAVSSGAHALNIRADEISRDPLFMGNDSVAKILQTAVESSRQQAAMLQDWCKRRSPASGGADGG